MSYLRLTDKLNVKLFVKLGHLMFEQFTVEKQSKVGKEKESWASNSVLRLKQPLEPRDCKGKVINLDSFQENGYYGRVI